MDLKPKTILKRVFDFARSELERRSRPPNSLAEDVQPMHASPETPRTKASSHPAPCVLDVARNDVGMLHVEWSMTRDHVQRSESLAGEKPVLCLRLVTFEPGRDDVRREVVDRPFVELSGACDLGTGELRGVVSVGLRSGERFVSIVHHTV
jgi:hypothetical protein